MALEAGEIASDVNTSAVVLAGGSSAETTSGAEFERGFLPYQNYSVTVAVAFETAALDAKIGINYILNRRGIYIGRKPMVEIDKKPLTGLVYPYITTFQERARIEFIPPEIEGTAER